MPQSQTVLTLDVLSGAVAGSAAAFRCKSTLSPAGGPSDKVFPPTYTGGVYATEKRRISGQTEPVDCVLLDSVQSQANRMEEALQQAIDEGRLHIPVIEVDFVGNGLLTEIGKVTSLQAPHRIADAILRDSLLDGEPFRRSKLGSSINGVSIANATPLYELCPTALIFGMWDSTGPKGGLGAKFERAIVSEIVGVDVVYGVKTSSRIDPLHIEKNAGPLYRLPDGTWTLDPAEALEEIRNGKATGRKVLYQKVKGKDVYHDPVKDSAKLPDSGRPSTANHGNVTPQLSPVDQGTGRPLGGGVTLGTAEQTIVLSLSALRRLKFPLKGGKPDQKVNIAARTVLAALGLCASALAAEKGFDLRSRCLLWPSSPIVWELLDRPGQEPSRMTLRADDAIALLTEAVKAAEKIGLRWRTEPLMLKASPQLSALVRKSQELAVAQSGEAEGGQ